MSRRKSLGRGWWFESQRHRLARLGIKTGRKQKEVLSMPKRIEEIDAYGEDTGIAIGDKVLLENGEIGIVEDFRATDRRPHGEIKVNEVWYELPYDVKRIIKKVK